ncbi:MAG: membrane protein insertion efficiency factor YidD [bacterium]
MNKLFNNIFFLIVITSLPASLSAKQMKGPWEKSVPRCRVPSVAASGRFDPLSLAVQLFRRHLSQVDGSRCQMYPTCSHYSLLAFQKHGLVAGYLMTVDRFLHESQEWKYAPLIEKYGHWRVFDPVEANDFWWADNSPNYQPTPE